MNITEVRIKLMDEPGDRLKAFCSITFDDCFVIRDLKIIEGTTGPFVAMPSRKLTAHCGKCGMKNHLRANHCNQCGIRLEEGRAIKDHDGRTKLYADIAHPINSRCREMIQERVVEEFENELERSKSPNYISRYDDYDGGDFSDSDVVIRRVDEPQQRTTSNRPHHPPQGDPIQTGTNGGPKRGGPHIRTQHERSVPNVAPSQSADVSEGGVTDGPSGFVSQPTNLPNNGQGSGGQGFGAGIF